MEQGSNMLFWWCRPAPLTNGRATLLASALGPSISAAHPLHPAQRTNAEESFRSALGHKRTWWTFVRLQKVLPPLKF